MTDNLYLDRYAWKESLFDEYDPPSDLGLIVVIPAFKELQLKEALDSLNNCDSPEKRVLIIIIVNESEAAEQSISEINQKSLEDLECYDCQFDYLIAYQKLPHKKAGVGLARKIGMDEAVRVFKRVHADGIIICYDADTRCDPNYLQAIENAFNNSRTQAGVVFYEHQLGGLNHLEIVNYELYLRYYIDALRYAGFPFAHQTLGSCIIVRSSTYQKQGGMNTRKAGEDFYFLNKIIPLGGFEEINETTLYPSDRISDRVPFGTGKAIGELKNIEKEYQVYAPEIFEDLKSFFSQVEQIWKTDEIILPPAIHSFLKHSGITSFEEIRSQTANYTNFRIRFFKWFDAFRILKFVHYARDNFYSNINLEGALHWLGKVSTGPLPIKKEDKLSALRAFDRKGFKPGQIDS